MRREGEGSQEQFMYWSMLMSVEEVFVARFSSALADAQELSPLFSIGFLAFISIPGCRGR